MKVRPQLLISLVAAGCVGLSGVPFATAQQVVPRQKLQRPDSPNEIRRDVQKRGTQRDSKVRIDARTRTSVHFRSSVFIGAPVSISGGTSLGTVQEFVLGDGGCVDFVIVTHDNRLVAIPWIAGTFRADDRVFLLDIDEAQIAQLPVFTDFAQLSDTTFVTKVNVFFKVDERRRDRRDRRDDGRKSAREDRPDTAKDGKTEDGKAEDGKDQPDAGKPAPKTRETTPAPKSRSGSETKKTETPKKAGDAKQDSTKK